MAIKKWNFGTRFDEIKKREEEAVHVVEVDGKKVSNKTSGSSKYIDLAPIKQVEVINDFVSSKSSNKKATTKSSSGTGYLQKGALSVFDDGYDVGDITKTILGGTLGTAADVGVGLFKGLGGVAEGFADLIGYAGAGVADLIGKDDYAEEVRGRVQENTIDKWVAPLENKVNKYSFLGDKSDSIAQGLGYVGTILATGGAGAGAGLGTAGTTALTSAVTGLSSMGSGMSTAYQGGATDEEAFQYGAITGLAEAGTELLFGGLGKAVNAVGLSKGVLALDDALAKKVTSKMTNQIAKNFTEYGIKAGAEGFEEVASGFIQALGKKATYMSEEELGKIVKDENLMDQFIAGAITSGIAQSGYVPGMKQGSLREANKTGTDFITGYTQNEQKVVDSLVNEQTTEIAKRNTLESELNKAIESKEAEQGGILSTKEKNALKSKIEAQIANGEIDISSTKVSNKDISKIRKAVEENMQKGLLDTNAIENVLGKDTDLSNDSILQRSYLEQAKRKEAFTYENKTTDVKEKAVYESATKYFNNTTRSHEFVDRVAKISKDKGTNYGFINNEELKSLGHDVEGKQVNGLVRTNKDGEQTVLINIDSPKALETIVGHETTHLLEGTQEYQDLQEAIFNYAKEKGDFDTRQKSLNSLYEGIENANVDSELTADLVGDYLFTDTDFINSLSTQKPTVFQRIKELIDDLVVRFTGAKEEKALREVQKKFKEAYRNNAQSTEGTQYAVSDADFSKSKVTDGKGNLLTLYHGTNENFDTFENVKTEPGYWFTEDKEYASEHGKNIMEVNLNLTNPLDVNTIEGEEILWDTAREVYGKENVTEKEVLSNKVKDKLKALGYDGMIWEHSGKNTYIAFEPSQIKKTDADTKYSMSDNQGRTLTKEQREYFKDSKVRDENGNLLTMYHGTPNGDYTVFKPGSYFSSRKEYADGYQNTWASAISTKQNANNPKTYEVYLNITNPFTLQNPEAKNIYLNEFIKGGNSLSYDPYTDWTNDINNLDEIDWTEAEDLREWLEENHPEYDGLVLDEGGDGGYGEAEYRWRGKSFVPFNSNQIKNVDNTKPTENPDIRYSLSEDTQGRKLTDNQKEYFKDVIPELKDENGNLKVLYHGTPNEFTQFNYDFIGSNGTALGKGFYLTDDRTVAEGYVGENGNVMEVYANITKPMLYQDRSMTKAEYKKFVEAVDKATEGQFLSDYGEVDYEGYATVLNRALQDYEYGGDDIDLVHGVLNTAGLTWEQGFRILKDVTGYDGVVSNKGFLSKEGTVYIPTLPEQIKSITNENPTDNPDINLSLSQQNEVAPTKNPNLTYGEDVKLQVEEAIAPLQEQIKALTEQVTNNVTDNVKVPEMPNMEQIAPIKEVEYTQPTKAELDNLMSLMESSGTEYANAFFALRDKYGQRNLYKGLNQYNQAPDTYEAPIKGDEFAPIPQDIVEKQNQEAFNNIDESNMPGEPEDTTPDTQSEMTATESLFETRSYEDVGDRKVNAYQYDNPEVKPYFQEAAQQMLYDLDNSIKGERIYNSELAYQEGIADQNGAFGWTGIKRQTTDDIAELLDGMDGRFKLQREDIRKGLNAIINDEGSENNAASKRIEFYLDQRLREGYTTVDGYEIPANQEYIKMIEANTITDAHNNFPITDDLAPVRTQEANTDTFVRETTPDIPKTQNVSNSESIAPIKEKYEAITPEKEPKMKKVSNNPEHNKIAEVLTTEPKTESDRNKRKWAIFKANVLDKGIVFEDLSLKENNRELIAKWDYTLTSEARGQYAIGNGHNGLSKSLNDIRAEVENTGNTKDFYNYMYHKHNVDRMSLASRFEGMENKPVFGDSVTAEQSQAIVNEYEKTHPEFLEFAQDVYDYVNADKQLLVDNGVISQETADLWSKMYPHYVPTRRTTDTGIDINVPLDTRKTGINAPIKKATGGNANILPLFDTMAMRTLQTYRATAKNSFGVELMNTMGTTIESNQTNVDEVIDSIEAQDGLLQEGKKGKNPTFTVFEDGEKITFEITKDMYDALKPVSESSLLSKTIKPLNVAGNIRRGLLTEYNPTFMLTNAIKDTQDILLNSQHATKTYFKIPEAHKQLLTKGYWYNEYIANGGEQNSYFDNETNTFKTENKGLAKIMDIPPLSTISKINNYIEMIPRLAEYIASRESGRSIEVSMLDAARVTTNFKAGGAVTKWANRNGATFLNASVQGAMQQVRNIREAKANGIRGWVNLATKFTIAGLPAILLNNLVWEDDEEYEELSDYVKQNYYVVGKADDGTFIRIPKGRTVAVIQDAINQMSNLVTGDDEVDLKSFIDLTINNLAPNNPLDNNIFSPIMQAATNTAWYGGDLLPTRLQNLPAAEQYDESTDMFSRWVGETFNVSPYKVNYLLDQYSGGVGDILLPMMTPEAESDGDSALDYAIAPLKNKFTTNSTTNNQNISDFYDISEELTTNANKSDATDKDILSNKYVNAVKAEMNELYKEKREIQNSNIPNSEKYDKVKDIQSQINELAKNALSEYTNVSSASNYSTVGDREYYKRINSEGEVEWTKVNDEEAEELNKLSLTRAEKNTYFSTKSEISSIVKDYKNNKEDLADIDEDSDEYKDAVEKLSNDKKAEIVNKIKNTGFNDRQKAYMYKKYYNSDTVDTIVAANINVDAYLDYATQDIESDKDKQGNSIPYSRKNKVIEYVNSMDLSIPEKAILIKATNTFKFNDYNKQIVEYVSGLDISLEEKVDILEDLDMTVSADGTVRWK